MKTLEAFANRVANRMADGEETPPQLDPVTLQLILTAAVELLKFCTARVRERIERIRNPSRVDRVRLWGVVRQSARELGVHRAERVGKIASAMIDAAQEMNDDELAEAMAEGDNYLAA